jgi:hypothetical protein
MGISDFFTFKFFKKFKTLYFYVSENYDDKYIERYIQKEHTKKITLKIIIFYELQKR